MKAIIASTHVDDGRTLTKEALEEIVRRDKGRVFPLTPNFNVQGVPLGNAVISGVVELDDGCYGLEADISLIEGADDALKTGGYGIGWVTKDDSVTLHNVSVTTTPSDAHAKGNA